MYCALHHTSRYEPNWERIHEIRKRESTNYRNEKARKLIKELAEKRKQKNIPSPRAPVLVSRNLEHLPKPGVY